MTTQFSGFSCYATSTQQVDELITICYAWKVNTVRIAFNPDWFTTKPHPYNKDLIQYLLDHSNLKIIVDRNHLYPPTAETSNAVNWSQAQTSLLAVCADFPNNDRVMVELMNEYVNSDWKTRMQTLVDAIRNAGYTNYIIANKWTTSWSQSVLTDTLNKIYHGMHFYFNSWSPSGAETQMGYAVAQNLKIINTEIGAHSSEYTNYTQALVDETNEFIAWCHAHANELNNIVWLDDTLASLTPSDLSKYEDFSLTVIETQGQGNMSYPILENLAGSWGTSNGSVAVETSDVKYTLNMWNGWVWKRPPYGQWWNLKDKTIMLKILVAGNYSGIPQFLLASGDGWNVSGVAVATPANQTIILNQANFPNVDLENVRSLELYFEGVDAGGIIATIQAEIADYAPTQPIEPDEPDEIPTGQIKSLGTQCAGFIDVRSGIFNMQGETMYAGVDNYRPDAVRFNLQHMKDDYKMTHIRCIINTTWAQENSFNNVYIQNLQSVAAICKEKGFKMVITGYAIAQGQQTDHPFVSGGFSSADAFATFWQTMANKFNAYDNVLFEVWNEVHNIDAATWFSAVQTVINKVRSVSQVPLLISYDYKIWNNLQFGGGSTLDWIWTYPLTGTNLIYVTHIYYPNFYDAQNNPITSLTGIEQGFDMCKLYQALNEGKKIWLTEVGSSLTMSSMGNPEWFSNTLIALNKLPLEGVDVGFWTCTSHISFGLLADGIWLPAPNENGVKVQQLINPNTTTPVEPPANQDTTIILAVGAVLTILGAATIIISQKKG